MANIPVNASDRVVVVVATSDGQTDFNFDFLVFTAGQVSIIHEAISDGAETELTAGDGFTVSGIGNANGGTVTITGTSVSTGDKVTIFGSTTIDRQADYQQGGDFFADTVNTEFDFVIMAMQEMQRDISRSLKLELGSSIVADISAAIAGRVLTGREDGGGIEGGPLVGEIEAAAGQAQIAIDKAAEAAASADAAAASRTEADIILDSFDDRYLGTKADDPVLDNDGDPLNPGALYVNTGENQLRFWTGVDWVPFNLSLSSTFLKVNNLSELPDADAALANLGLTALAIQLAKAPDLTALRSIMQLGGLATQDILNEATLVTNSTTRPPSQSAVKQYVDNLFANPFGPNARWRSMLPERVGNTVYQNTTAYPIAVRVRPDAVGQGRDLLVSHDNIEFNLIGFSSANAIQTHDAIILPGHYYRLTATPSLWAELRSGV